MSLNASTGAGQLLLPFLMAACISCSAPGKYTWVDAYQESRGGHEQPYRIAAGDMVQVRVFNQEHLTTRARVRPDGKVSLPLLNDVPAAGLTPDALATDLQERLKSFIKAPLVTVALEETRPASVYVAGEVVRPGVYPLDAAAGVLQALVNAGGLTQMASPGRIFVLRKGPPEVRIRFTYDALVRLEGKASTFHLLPGDVVVVE